MSIEDPHPMPAGPAFGGSRRLRRLFRGQYPRLSSVVGRYVVVTVTIFAVALVSVGALYDRFTKELETTLVGERQSAQEAATANRMAAFLETMQYQLAKISNYPGLNAFLANPEGPATADIAALLRLEADVPDLYGILFFDAHDKLRYAIAGQAASGPPYWTTKGWSIAGLPLVVKDGVEIIGPTLPEPGRAGWILLRRPMRESANGTGGSVALHVRLASMTEQLDKSNTSAIVRLLLSTPSGAILDATGRPITDARELAPGPEVLPGWRLMRDRRSPDLISSLRSARSWLYVGGALVMIVVVALFVHLGLRMRRRVDLLVEGANAVASGNLTYRLPMTRQADEINALSSAFNTMAERVKEMIDRTVHTEKMAVLGQFATGVAHEVRNPLATMKTTVQSLSRDEPDEDRRELLIDLEAEVDRLNRVVNDLLTYGRPHPAARGPQAVRELLRRTATLLKPVAAEHGVHLASTGDSSVGLLADEDHMQQILVNLGLNAIQACARGGTVTFRSRREGERTVIEIADDGHGIARADIARVTDPFFTTKPTGSGLGLTISEQMVQANEGTMNIESTLGVGTLISLSFPAADPTREGA
ncbi:MULTISPECIES: PAS domain-containing sensor histidine kinase [unclassified Xanthobacter]|uniref:sensor histidine kinase n=1 Tax=unclassified Xanthobacter TaxID=2623496 RepID=UPI001F2589F3|nr:MULTISPECIES: HAMP domain-containing sensor histidine kinase [unclassified Xanthobacter]